MKTRRVLRHYCDHCHRGKFKRPDMERHESVCFHNPRRACPECGSKDTDVAANIAFLEVHELDELKKQMGGCPACTMSAVIQHNKNHDAEEFVMYDTYKADRDEYRNEKFRTEHEGQAF